MMFNETPAARIHVSPQPPSCRISAFTLSSTPSSPRAIPALVISPPSPALLQSRPTVSNIPDETKYRPLSSQEARQLTLLLHQSLFPVRISPKCLMSESIRLAEDLHEAGIRWDKRRRVMGMHVRGIWEEGEKIGAGAGVGGVGHRAMERYVQGSFLSIAEDPHPLDTSPIPIERDARFFRKSPLPSLTLQSGLAQALGATATTAPPPMWTVGRSETIAVNLGASPMTKISMKASFAGLSQLYVSQRGWQGRRGGKRTGLRIQTGLPLRHHPMTPGSSSVPIRTVLLGWSLPVSTKGNGWTARTIKSVIHRLEGKPNGGGCNTPRRTVEARETEGIRTDEIAYEVGRTRQVLDDREGDSVKVEAGVRSVRRVSVGGWELR